MKMKIKKILLVSFLVLFVVTIMNSTIITAEDLKISYQEEVTTLDIQETAETSAFVIASQIFDTLVELDSDGKIVPSVATDWEIIDETSWEFHIRDDVTFHDGSPLTPEDIVFTIDRFKRKGIGTPLEPMLEKIERAEVKDQSIVIHTTEPFAPLLTTLTLVYLLPENISFDEPVGSGPFMFSEWDPGDRLVMESYANYWGGEPDVDQLIWLEIPEILTRAIALERGEIDLAFGLTPEAAERIRESEEVNILEAETFRMRWLWINGNREELNNKKVRQAIRYAIDDDAIIEHVMDGYAKPLNSIYAPGIIGYKEMKPWGYDPEKAIELLEEAGYSEGLEFDLDFAETELKQRDIAQAIASMLEQVNIEINLKRKDRAVWVEDLVNMDWDLNLFSNSNLTGDPDFQIRRLYHSEADRTGYENAEVDDLLEEALVETDIEKRAELYGEVIEIMWEDSPTHWMFVHQNLIGIRDNIEGFEYHPRGIFSLKDIVKK